MNEVVWREDVAKEVEYMTEGTRTLATFYHSAKYYGAPESLLRELAQVWSDLEQARKRLETLVSCFPEEPR